MKKTSSTSAKTFLDRVRPLSKKLFVHLKNFIYGVVIGAAMLIPGVSGGTTAIILGIYDRLLSPPSPRFLRISGKILCF